MKRSVLIYCAVMSSALSCFGARVTGQPRPCMSWDISYPSGASDSMAYDTARKVVVMFVGNSTWEWDGVSWELRATIGPGERSGHRIVYDSFRGVTVLFGGNVTDQGRTPDTWEWDGHEWRLAATDGPRGRTMHSMAYDSDRRVTVLHGGRSNSTSQGRQTDTWEWNGRTWSQRSEAGPGTELGAMAYDRAGKATILFGGVVGSSYTSNTWSWDGTEWIKLVTQEGIDSPVGRAFHSTSYDPVRQRILMYGGFTTRFVPSHNSVLEFYLSDIWTWEGDRWELVANKTVVELRGAGVAFDVNRGRLVVFGGRQRNVSSPMETWEWDGDGWLLRSGKPKKIVARGSLIYDRARNRSLLFHAPPFQNQMWIWDGNTWARSEFDTPLTSESLHNFFVYDEAREVVVLVDWKRHSGVARMWEFDDSGWTPVSIDLPSPRRNPLATYDRDREVIVLHGRSGLTTTAVLRDTWEFDGSTWELIDEQRAG
jgi:hypothetical protein